jgi:hypothetical protein
MTASHPRLALTQACSPTTNMNAMIVVSIYGKHMYDVICKYIDIHLFYCLGGGVVECTVKIMCACMCRTVRLGHAVQLIMAAQHCMHY